MTTKKFSRRQFLGATAALALAGVLGARPDDAHAAPRIAASGAAFSHHLSWVWQFSIDGEPRRIKDTLQEYGLGVLLKTHDGVSWMSEYDSSPFAVSGPARVAMLADYYEAAGVPFHAWCVVAGTQPRKEAQMAAAILDAGARSLYLDVEPHAGFWRGSHSDAIAYASELRRLAPDATIVLSVDPRPWALKDTPVAEFVPYVDAISPQQYWTMFNSSQHHALYSESGFPAASLGVTPEFLVSASHTLLGKYGLPVLHTGAGDSTGQKWRRFAQEAFADGSNFVSVWRHGITDESVFATLRAMPVRSPLGGRLHVVQPGETLSQISETYGTTVEDLLSTNGLADRHYIYAGQELSVRPILVTSASTLSPVTGTSYLVQQGDTLDSLAGRFGTDPYGIARLNGISNIHFIRAGERLLIP